MPPTPEQRVAAGPGESDPRPGETLPWWRDFLSFLRTEKRWWLVPLLILLVLLIVLAILTRQPARPPTYPAFHDARATPGAIERDGSGGATC